MKLNTLLCRIIFLLIGMYGLNSCRSTSKQTYLVKQINDSIVPVKISITDLAKFYKFYDGKYIETTGMFSGGFEDVAIYSKKSLFVKESKGFWLEIPSDLGVSPGELIKMSGKQITIKGMVDASSKGHMSAYYATIKAIYFWEE